MSDQNDVIGEILDEMSRITTNGGKVSRIVIHDAGLWTNLQDLAGANFERVPAGTTLFGVTVGLGGKSNTAKFTVEAEGSEITP
ncbi:hypothetical protein CYL20_07330 [Pseudomonas palleroniana]|uniref:Uncharacterized protein n=1 Tax=Pseudomonas palleroniana TaxID=191390 RepID=A0A2L1J783_9PSED|nr:hypothetical protein [Pseudomonas palleroniana]AVE04362.1 hypothetical protein CYL20_07330 [Pseudomonas palleroniana]